MLAYLGKTDGWFVFRSPRWQSIGMDVECVMALVDEQLHKTISEALQRLLEEDVTNDDEIKEVQGLLKSIAKLSFKKQLVEQLAISYRVVSPKQWLNQLDGNDYLMGFEDCVYNFHERCFREGRPEDMISMTTGHKQSDVETHMDGSEICDDIIHAVESMHEFEEVLWYVLKDIATSVVGNRPNDRFHIWSGSGGNGKGLTKNLVASAFGDYYYEPYAWLFASRSVSGSVLSSELAKLKGKRICVASEAEPGDKLRAEL
jgi:phage/plasmid-associated DNA primase